MIAPYSQTARSTVWNHAERERRRAEPPPHIPPRWYLREWLPWNKAHQDAFLKDSATWSLYWYIASYMNKYAIDQAELDNLRHEIDALKAAQSTPVPEHPPEAIDLQARYRLLQADLEFQRGETELQKTRANDLTDGLNDCRVACVEAGETEGPLNERIRRLAQRVTPAAGECPSCAALRERAEKAEAEAARWKQQWEASSYSLREYTRKHPVNPKAKLAVPRKPELEDESAGEEKDTVKQD